MKHAPSSWVRYLVVWLALLALTALSFLFSLAHLGAVDIVVALVIATVKTLLVVLVFMHLSEARFSVVMLPVAAVFLFALLGALLVTDVVTRRTFPVAPGLVEGELPSIADEPASPSP
jgi:cytochrome c oxidase subunit IV